MPLSNYEIEKTFGKFSYKSYSSGSIKIDPRWVALNIDQFKFKNHTIYCHHLILYQLKKALQEAERYVRTYDGCFVPRHILWDFRRSLSRHSWGVAIDLNASLNNYGTKGNQPKELIRAFKKWGFEFGGLWRTPDPMHFEAIKIISDSEVIELDRTLYKIRRADNKLPLFEHHSLAAAETYALGVVARNANNEPTIKIELVNPDNSVRSVFDVFQTKLYLGCK